MNDAVYIMSIGPGFQVEDFVLSSESCLSQTYKSDLYVFFDGVDLDKAVIEFLRDNDIVYFSAPQSKGLACRLNFLIDTIVERNVYKYVLRIDCGDVCLGNRSAKQVDFFQENDEVGVVGSDSMIYTDGVLTGTKHVTSMHHEISESLRWKNPMIHPSVAFRTSVLSDGFRYDEMMLRCQDYKFWVDLVVGGVTLANINEPLIEFHRDYNFIDRRAKSIAVFELRARLYAARKLGSICGFLYIFSGLIFVLRHLPNCFLRFVYRFK